MYFLYKLLVILWQQNKANLLLVVCWWDGVWCVGVCVSRDGNEVTRCGLGEGLGTVGTVAT